MLGSVHSLGRQNVGCLGVRAGKEEGEVVCSQTNGTIETYSVSLITWESGCTMMAVACRQARGSHCVSVEVFRTQAVDILFKSRARDQSDLQTAKDQSIKQSCKHNFY